MQNKKKRLQSVWYKPVFVCVMFAVRNDFRVISCVSSRYFFIMLPLDYRCISSLICSLSLACSLPCLPVSLISVSLNARFDDDVIRRRGKLPSRLLVFVSFGYFCFLIFKIFFQKAVHKFTSVYQSFWGIFQIMLNSNNK